MTRKSKKAGGHTPLTHYERTTKFKSSQYGTTTARLSTESQLPFGCCHLNLSPAIEDPVATPSGHIYCREAILHYLLTKTVELKASRTEYETYQNNQEQKTAQKELAQKEDALVVFENSQKASSSSNNNMKKRKSREDDDDDNNDESKKSSGKSVLARTSYWLAEYQPEHTDRIPEAPPERPSSPYSGNPLRRKELKSLLLKRSSPDSKEVLCALSEKTITTQPVVALLPSGHVILKKCYEELVQPTMINPFTSKRIKQKHVLQLQKGRSGFAQTGSVTAKKYRPTIT